MKKNIIIIDNNARDSALKIVFVAKLGEEPDGNFLYTSM